MAPLNGCYWYCWGTLHSGDDQYENPSPNTPLRVTKCICEPNVQKHGTSTFPHAHIPGGYGEHGVSHQVANRILWSAGVQNGSRITVEGVKGWQYSWWLYGPYGSDAPWPISVCEPETSQLNPETESAIDRNLDNMIAASLGQDFDAGKKNALQQLRTNVLQTKKNLNHLVETGKISRVKFAHEVNAMVAETLREAASTVLKGKDFEKLFGIPYRSGTIPLIVDPQMARVYP
jgi:hypothetical protein